MRLVLINPNTSQATTAAMLAIARGTAAASATITGLTAPYGAPLITDEAALTTAAEAVLSLAPALADGQPAGVIVAAFGDPGLLRMRAACACPVTGIAEAGMAEAAAGERRFAVVTTTPALAPAIARTAELYGHAAAFTGVRLTDGDPHAVMADPRRLEAALESACDEAIRRDGAEAIVIGGGPLATAARSLARRIPVPIIEPVPAAVRLALARASGSA